MNAHRFKELVGCLSAGKRLPKAVYVHVEALGSLDGELSSFIEQLCARMEVQENGHNVVKFSTNEFRVSLLSYPGFFETPHPVLSSSTTIELASGETRFFDYSKRHNPPILHRKEALLATTDPRSTAFRELTLMEESHGLYDTDASIGFKRNWEALLLERGLGYDGHTLIESQLEDAERVADTQNGTGEVPVIHRHRTALTRYSLSKPVRLAVEHGVLTKERTFFDYGCGRGDDLSGLANLGHTVAGWDPTFRPDAERTFASVVNLGYVLNVIEDPAERVDALRRAYQLTSDVLVVAALMQHTANAATCRPLADGHVTSRGTFQKTYDQQELRQFIEDALDATAVPAALGVFFVFRSAEERQAFYSRRYRRRIDWDALSHRLYPRRPRKRKLDSVYEEHAELLDAFWEQMLEVGRLPLAHEFDRHGELREAVGSPKRARRMFVEKFGAETLDAAFQMRRADWLVDLALGFFREQSLFRDYSESEQKDIKTFLGSYKQGLEEAKALLFSIADADKIEKACSQAAAGSQDHQDFYCHRDVLPDLAPLLRVYVGCAAELLGDTGEVDIIKIHMRTGKVTFLYYQDFERAAFPELHERLKVDLRRQRIDAFNHHDPERQQVLYFRSRFVSPNHPLLPKWQRHEARARKLGLDDRELMGPWKHELEALFQKGGLTPWLVAMRPHGGRSSPGCSP